MCVLVGVVFGAPSAEDQCGEWSFVWCCVASQLGLVALRASRSFASQFIMKWQAYGALPTPEFVHCNNRTILSDDL